MAEDETAETVAEAEAAPAAAETAESEEERLAREFEEAASGNDGRILSQNEIDSLLGFDANDDGGKGRGGIRAIVNSALISYERLPMLEVVFDRLVRMLTTSLRNFTSDNVEVSFESITAIRFGDYLNSIPLPAILSVFRAVEWDNLGLITVDSALIYSVVDVLLGGRRGSTMRIEGRPYTTIERNLIERLINVVLADMSAAFEPVAPVVFTFDRIETNPRFATIARHANAAILCKLRVDLGDRGGELELLLPYATLEPVRKLLLQMFMGEKFGRDTIWENHLATELWSTDVEIEAVLDQQSMPLRDVVAWKTGTTLLLNVTPNNSIELRCGGVPMVAGKMGRIGNNIAVRVDRTMKRTGG